MIPNFFKFQSIFHNDNPREFLCQHSSFNLSFTSSGVFSSQQRCLNVFLLIYNNEEICQIRPSDHLVSLWLHVFSRPGYTSFLLYASILLHPFPLCNYINFLSIYSAASTWLLFPDSRFSWLLQTHCISFIIQEERETDERLLRNRRKITYPSYSSAGRVSCFNKRNLLLLNPKDQGDKFYDKYSKS